MTTASARASGVGEDGATPLIVDVRETDEFATMRVPGAVLMPLSGFADSYENLPRDRPLLIMCAAGSRSMVATDHLLRHGFGDVTNVVGGITAWRAAGLPVRSGAVEPGEGDLPSA
ncbi:MAG: rhodanese-like domain-containing protein [Candidatus Limnocylindrales bacterium]